MYFNHFSCKEFFPNCTKNEIFSCINDGFFDNLLLLFQFLDGFRDYIEEPIKVTSTFRDSTHNMYVGGALHSEHLVGSAIDFQCKTIPFDKLVYLLKTFLKESAFKNILGQVIFYHKKQFIHVGLRSPQFKTLIYYDKRDN